MSDEFDDILGGDDDATHRTPPYVAFSTFITFLKALKTDGLPPQIDKSVLSKLSGGVQGQMKLSLRSLGLMDGDKPTSNLVAMVDAFDTPDFESVLLDRLKATYPYVFALDLMSATPTMLADAFKSANSGAKEDVLRKCRTFFLYAAKRAGVPLGQRILTGSVPRSTPAGSKRKPKAKAVNDMGAVQAPALPSAIEISDKLLEYKLIDLMREDGVEEAERSAIWTLVQYLTAKAKKAASLEPAAS